jgi:predicted ferric reductase
VTHAVLGIGAVVSAHVHVHLAGRYTDAAWKEAVLIAISAVMVGLFLYLRFVKPALVRRSPYRVAEVRPERGRCGRCRWRPSTTRACASCPGQYGYLKLRSPYSLHEHPFSLASSAERPDRLEFAIKELGDFTNGIGRVPPGTAAFVDGPHGSFSPDLSGAAGFVLIAGGIGIAPFMSVLRTMADRGDPRPVLLVYGEKRWDDVAFREELDELRQRIALDVVFVLERPPDDWTGEVGFVNQEMLLRVLPRSASSATCSSAAPTR